MQYGPTVEIRNMTRGSSSRVPFKKIAQEILPERYQLSLVLCGDTLSRRINRTYRQPRQTNKKNYVPNVLSFPLDKYEGEIFLNVRKAEREAKTLGISARKRIAHLFVHGCLHLKGLKHGTKMDASEKRILKKFRYKMVNRK